MTREQLVSSELRPAAAKHESILRRTFLVAEQKVAV